MLRSNISLSVPGFISVPGFCPKLLAVRPVPRARNISASLFRLHIFYLFTLLGLSLPYRIWFAKHCDEVRVSVVKETSDSAPLSEDKEQSSLSSDAKSSWLRSKIWGSSPATSSAEIERKRAQETFRKSMQSFSLYEDEPNLLDLNLKERTESLNTTTSAVRESTTNNHDTAIDGNDGIPSSYGESNNTTCVEHEQIPASTNEPDESTGDVTASSDAGRKSED